MHVNCGNPNHPDERYCAVAGDKPSIVEFVAHMAPGNTIRIAPYGFGLFYIKDLAAYEGPGLAIDWVEVEGPLTDAWPPESHQRLLGNLDLKKASLAEAEQVLRVLHPACLPSAGGGQQGSKVHRLSPCQGRQRQLHR